MSREKSNEQGEHAEEIYRRLLAIYGEPVWRPRHSPLDELILTILSANTNDINSGRAFATLMERFDHDWDAIRTAPIQEIKDAIRVAGMYNQKAPNIVATLDLLLEDVGRYNLDHVAQMATDEALTYLQRFPGVGHKTASIVLLFCFNKGTFPVDTHVQRQSQRLGISRPQASPARVKADWEALLPAETYYALHVNLIQHGRAVCTARQPLCQDCALNDLCAYAQSAGAWTA